jgi:hypothetical protein
MNTYPISKENKNHEFQHIKTILHNNNYPPQTYLKVKTRMNKNRTSYTPQKQKYATFTYIGTEIIITTNLLKNTNIRIACRTKNTYKTTYNQRMTPQTYITKVSYTKLNAKISNSNT